MTMEKKEFLESEDEFKFTLYSDNFAENGYSDKNIITVLYSRNARRIESSSMIIQAPLTRMIGSVLQ